MKESPDDPVVEEKAKRPSKYTLVVPSLVVLQMGLMAANPKQDVVFRVLGTVFGVFGLVMMNWYYISLHKRAFGSGVAAKTTLPPEKDGDQAKTSKTSP